MLTDSPSDLPEDLIRRYRIEVVPAVLVLDGHPYLDGRDISRAEFYNRLPNLLISPTTASAASRDFSVCAAKLFDSGCEHVLGIFTAEKLTAAANTARKAAEEFNGRFSVIESGSLSMGTGFQVLAAAEAIENGQGLEQVLAEVQSVRQRLKVFAALDTVEYMRRSGRVPRAVGGLGGLLNIKPVVELREGQVHPLDAPRTSRRAADKLLSLLAELGPLERLSILHTNAEARANELLARLQVLQNGRLPADIRVLNVTTVIGTHVGPNGLGVAAVRNSR
ncbi:MAG TPA: DegV family protein [Anaerolineales bacterium]